MLLPGRLVALILICCLAAGGGDRSGIQRQAQVTVSDSLVGQVGVSVMGKGSPRLPEVDGVLPRSNYLLDFGADFAGDEAVYGSDSLTLAIGEEAPVELGMYTLHEFVDRTWFQTVLGTVSCVFDVGKGDQGYGYLDRPDQADETDREAWCDQGLIGRPIRDDRNPRWRGQPFDPTYA